MHNRYTNQSLPGARQQFEQEARLLLRTHPGYVMTILVAGSRKLQRLKAAPIWKRIRSTSISQEMSSSEE